MDNKIAKLQQARLRAREKGFTLVELAIVLVIIGLIIGGVLVGQDLIKAAEIRAQITQIEQYNAAVNTFRTKYNGLPGDLRNAVSFFPVADFGAAVRNGNGNRQLEQCVTAASGLCGSAAAGGPFEAVDTGGSPTHDGEVIQFWHHLSLAELINGSYNGTAGDGSAPNNYGGLGFTFPVTRLDRNGVGVFAAEGRNFYQLGVISGAAYEVDPSLSPEEAFNLDSKIDDGRPGSGSVIIRGGTAGSDVNAPLAAADVNFAGATATACIQEAIASPTDPALLRTATYALANKELACTLRLRMN